MLSQLNEAALVDASGARASVTFARTFPKGTSSQSAAGTTRREGLVVDGPDFKALMSTRDGAVVELTQAPALRLSIDKAVRAGKVVLRPAPAGTGVIAGGPMRAVLETLGVQDVVGKSIGSSNPYNMVRATFDALKGQSSPRQVASKRGKKVADILTRRADGASTEAAEA